MSADNSSTMMARNNDRANSFNTAANNALSNLQRSASSSTSSPLDIPYQIFSPPSAQPSSVINFSNSSDVVIGSSTQYHGPVTIYHYMDATLETRTTQAGGAITSQRSSTQTAISQKLGTTSKLLILLIVLVVIVTGIILYIELSNKLVSVVKSAPILFGNNYEHGTFPNLGNGHLVIDRTQWGANDEHPNGELKIRLKHPTPYVLITHIGVQSVPCYTIYKCSIKMRTIQDSARAEKNLPDIQGNFYVADDGNIYVGRGWDWANTYANDTLAISFMGDYARYKPSPEQLEALQYLLAHAVVNDYITKDYKLVAQNQTRISKSPGANVFQAIKTWPHFYPCGMFGNPPCGSELGMPEVWDAKM